MRLGVCYYPEHWPPERWGEDARLMAETGISRVRIGEFAWSRLEPSPRRFDWAWLDDAIEALAAEGHGVILGTPTATPPKWLVDRMPDMVALDREGRPRGFGSRRHYCFSHEGYRKECARIVRAMAERYGGHPAVVAWQTDNEYGCHDTVQSFSAAARDAFRRWLAERYGTIEALNDAWGNVFWSMAYRSFGQVDLPNLTVTEANPAHWLAFRRFSSDQVITFNRAQADIIREHSPGRDVVHNAMGFYTGYDHHDLGADLDAIGWDSYPLGFLEMFRFSEEDKRRYARTGHPDIAAFHHDLYRGCIRGGRWWVLEQQPGPVNWARHNPAPAPGMVRLWTLEAMAHGAELVSYFRWRQFPQAQEQMHAGLLRTDGAPAPALAEAREAADEIAALGDIGAPVKHAALVFSYDSEWITQIQPQGEGCSALWAVFACYSALRRLGLNVDIIAPGTSLAGYELTVVPCLPIVPDALANELSTFEGQVVIGPRTGSRDADFAIPPGLAPGPLEKLVGGKVVLSETLRPGLVTPAEDNAWAIARWHDTLEGIAEPELVAADGRVACWRHGRVRYCATWPEGSVIETVIERAARNAGLPAHHLPEGSRRRTTTRYQFDLDYLHSGWNARPSNSLQVEDGDGRPG
ncbi:Beta-galactosidase [Tsuneonella dongtanensis]|uniref:Beta-galactosidase n=1 Tax=Tsuneonella dongtanensis TaxID=692370 RepID=A0A1B2ABU7_9SPHN|nr:beta-galactosidase [Tsuneonella dongtanensis]ANY19642.1 Beta-galactosidase [Tsuneonella dongtanensis]